MHQWPFVARLYAGGALASACAIVVVSSASMSVLWVALLTVSTLALGYGACVSLLRAERAQAREMAELTTTLDGVATAHREIHALYDIAQTISSGLAVSDTMALVSPKLSNLVPFSSCALFVYSAHTDMLQSRFVTGVDAELFQQLEIRNGQGLAGWVGRNRRPLINAQPQADLAASGSQAVTVLHSALVCPLIVGDELIGAIAVYHLDAGFYQDNHARLLERISSQAAGVIHNAMIFEETQRDSLTDPLTGLPNRRALFQQLSRELSRAERVKAPVSVIVMDLDDFKVINDTCGHRAGDRALREVGNALRAAIRPYDTCVRYAGDEFVVVLSGCGREEADVKRRELQEAVAAMDFDVDAKPFPLSISAGIAVYPQDGDSNEVLLASADREMYVDKHGRKTDPLRRAAGGTQLAS